MASEDGPSSTMAANTTCPLYPDGSASSSTQAPVYLICTLTILTNFFLFGLILSSKELRKQGTNMFMISLGVCDILLAINYLIFNSVDTPTTDFLKQSHYRCLANVMCRTFLVAASWYNFVGLNLDRLFALKNPSEYIARGQTSIVGRHIGLCWVLPVLPTIPLWFDTTVKQNLALGCDCIGGPPFTNQMWALWTSVTIFILPTCAIFTIWIMMAQSFRTSPPIESLLKTVTLKLCGITALFLACIFPYCIVFIMAALEPPRSAYTLTATWGLAMANSLVQPGIYICIGQDLRTAALSIIRRTK